MTNQTNTGENQCEDGDEPSLVCVDKFLSAIDQYLQSEGVRSCKVNPEAEKAINLDSETIKVLTHDELFRYAYILYQYCNYVQGIFNKHLVKLKWVEEQLSKIVSSQASQFDKYMKWEQKRHAAIQNDEFAKVLWELKLSAEGKVTWLSDKIRDMRKQADVLFELAKGKRYR